MQVTAERKVLSMPAPLIEEIEKKIKLSDGERRLIGKTLNSSIFREFLMYDDFWISSEYVNARVGIDAPKKIMGSFSMFTTSAYMLKKFIPEQEEEISVGEINKKWRENKEIIYSDWVFERLKEIFSPEYFSAFEKGELEIMFPQGDHYSPNSILVLQLSALPVSLLGKISEFTALGRRIKYSFDKANGLYRFLNSKNPTISMISDDDSMKIDMEEILRRGRLNER